MNSESAGAPACSKCGVTLRIGAAFCARCGTRAGDDELTPPSPASAEPTIDRSRELRVVAWLYGLMLLTSMCFGIAYSIRPEGDYEPWIALIFAIIVVSFAAGYVRELFALLRPSTLDRPALNKLSIAAAIQFAVMTPVFYLLQQAGIPFERATDDLVRHGYALWQMLFFLSLVPAVLEEIAFRGIIQRRLQFVLGEREAWLVQAALFSVLHLSPVIFLTHFAMGLLFGWLRTRTGSLIPCIILHGAWNAAIVVAELYF